VRGAAEDCQKTIGLKPLIIEVHDLKKSLMLIRLKSFSLGLVVIGSKSMPICNRFYGRLANNGQTRKALGERRPPPSMLTARLVSIS